MVKLNRKNVGMSLAIVIFAIIAVIVVIQLTGFDVGIIDNFNSNIVCTNFERTLMNSVSGNFGGTGTASREIKNGLIKYNIKANLPETQPTFTLSIPDICDSHCNCTFDCYNGCGKGTCPVFKAYVINGAGKKIDLGVLKRFRDGFYYLYKKGPFEKFRNYNKIIKYMKFYKIYY